MSMQIGSQTVTLNVQVQGNTQLITFQAQITAYNGQQLSEPQTITVQITCLTTKPVRELVNGQPQRKKVPVLPEECLQNLLKAHEKIYTWV
jgi:hypothetical protein